MSHARPFEWCTATHIRPSSFQECPIQIIMTTMKIKISIAKCFMRKCISLNIFNVEINLIRPKT